MNTPSRVQFEPTWEEELVCTMDGRSFVIALTMGIPTVYFPTRSRWEASAPDWARQHWERVREDLQAWCEETNLPLVIEAEAWAIFE